MTTGSMPCGKNSRGTDAVRSDVEKGVGDLQTNVAVLKWLFVAMIAVFGLIATILALAANII